METFGDRLRALRKQRGLSQGQLGDRFSVTTKAVGKWESGDSHPKTARLNEIAEFFETTVEWLINGHKTLSSNVVEVSAASLPKLPVIGSVRAGYFQGATQDEEEWDYIAFPVPAGYNPADFFILRVQGDSMNEIYNDGSLLVCCRIEAYNGELREGARVIVHRRDEYSDQFEATVKELVHDPDNGVWLLMPRSHNPQYRPITIPNGTGEELDFAGTDDLKITAVVYTGFMPEPVF